jgi:hypothetical protein
MRKFKFVATFILLTLLLCTATSAQASVPLALSRTAAKDYADAWATSRNPNYKSFKWDCTNSWSVVGDFRSLLYARGWGTWMGLQTPGTHNGALRGDILGYDWEGDASWDHASVEVVYDGCDPDSGWCGDLVDQHTTDRYHAFWTLQPYNPDWQTTLIGLWRVHY